MADAKISQLNELTTPGNDDFLAIVDLAATPDETKKITRKNMLAPRGDTLVVAAVDSVITVGADYLCDGVDDDVDISAAIVALSATGGRVMLLDGNYNITNSIVMNATGVVLAGQGEGTILKLGNGVNLDVISVGTTSVDSVVKEVTIDGNLANNSGGAGILIDAAAVNTSVLRCHIFNTVGANILDNGGTNTRIVDNYLDTTATGNSFGNIEGLGNNAVVSGNICISADWAGVALYNGTGASVFNNIIKTSNLYGIYVGSPQVAVSNNLIQNAASDGIYITSSGYYSTIAGNVVYTNTGTPNSLIRAGAASCTISNNVTAVDTGNASAVEAIIIANNQITLQGNLVNFTTSQSHIGIHMVASYTDLNITGNIVYNQTDNGSSLGIQDDGGCTQGIINSNYFYNFNTGADMQFQQYMQITNNLWMSCDIGGLFKACDDCQYIGNTFYGNNTDNIGVNFNTGATNSRNTFNNNRISGFGRDGLYLGCFQNGTVVGNTIEKVGQTTNDTYSGILITDDTSIFSVYNIITNNNLSVNATNKPKYQIRENSASDGPNIITNNIATGAITTQISTQHANTVTANNITS